MASDLSMRVANAEMQQASAKETTERAQATSDAAVRETVDTRRDQQIAHARLDANLQVAAMQSQSTGERAVAQAMQAMADARNANVEVPRLDATLFNLQAELHAMKVATQ